MKDLLIDDDITFTGLSKLVTSRKGAKELRSLTTTAARRSAVSEIIQLYETRRIDIIDDNNREIIAKLRAAITQLTNETRTKFANDNPRNNIATALNHLLQYAIDTSVVCLEIFDLFSIDSLDNLANSENLSGKTKYNYLCSLGQVLRLLADRYVDDKRFVDIDARLAEMRLEYRKRKSKEKIDCSQSEKRHASTRFVFDIAMKRAKIDDGSTLKEVNRSIEGENERAGVKEGEGGVKGVKEEKDGEGFKEGVEGANRSIEGVNEGERLEEEKEEDRRGNEEVEGVNEFGEENEGDRPARKTRKSLVDKNKEPVMRHFFVALYRRIVAKHADGVNKRNFYRELDQFRSDDDRLNAFCDDVRAWTNRRALDKMHTFIRSPYFQQRVQSYADGVGVWEAAQLRWLREGADGGGADARLGEEVSRDLDGWGRGGDGEQFRLKVDMDLGALGVDTGAAGGREGSVDGEAVAAGGLKHEST